MTKASRSDFIPRLPLSPPNGRRVDQPLWTKYWEADWAGTQPAGYTHLLAVTVMNEVDINIAPSRKSCYFFASARRNARTGVILPQTHEY